MQIKDIFEQINYDIFGGELDMPIFITHYYDDDHGYYIRYEGLDIISIRADEDYFTGVTTLAHEMIHLWQEENGLKTNHGYKFKMMARTIENFYNLENGDI